MGMLLDTTAYSPRTDIQYNTKQIPIPEFLSPNRSTIEEIEVHNASKCDIDPDCVHKTVKQQDTTANCPEPNRSHHGHAGLDLLYLYIA